MTQNLDFWNCQNRGPIWRNRDPILAECRDSCLDIFRRRFRVAAENQNIFLGLILFQFFRDAFTINIDLVSDEKVSREPKNKGFRSQHQN